MFLNYLKLAIRLLSRNPFFTLINVIGLAVGFTVFFILSQYSRYELDSDKQWKHWDQIARIGLLWEWSDNGQTWDSEKYGTSGPPLPVQVSADFPEVDSYTRILPLSEFNRQLTGLDNNVIISFETKDQAEVQLLEEKIVMADANLFEFFSIPLLKGSASHVLKEANSVVISSAIAKKYFGQEEPMGQMILINKQAHVVSGVFSDLPPNTHIDFQIVLSNLAKIDYWSVAFGPPCVTSYVKIHSPVDWNAFERKLNDPAMIEKYYGPALKLFKSKATNIVQPLSEIAFSQKWRGDQFTPKSKTLLHIFKSVGWLVLVLAFVNYISLSTSRINNRLSEVATRKVSGASSTDFIQQFVIESGLIISISLALAFTLLQLVKHPLYVILQIPVFRFDRPSLFLVLLVVGFMIFLSAAYPTYLSHVSKIRDLFRKGNQMKGYKGFHWSLTSLQLSIAIILIIWAFMIFEQVQYVLSKDLGFSKANLVTIDAPIFKTENFEADLEVFKNKLRPLTSIQDITSSSSVMGDGVSGISVRRSSNATIVALDSNGGVDENFIPFYNIKILTGRNFNESDQGNSIIVSEGALPRLGFNSADEAVGSIIELASYSEEGEAWKDVTIIGVMKSYRLRPMLKFSGDHDTKEDAGIALTRHYLNSDLQTERITLRIDAKDTELTLRAIEQIYAEMFPGNVFNWYFLDDHINRHYRSEEVWRNQILFFTCLAIGIACLGMLGMISLKAAEKTKEIGIRKVLGAQLHQIALMLLSTTMKQITIATAIGIPVAYYLTQQYLEKYSERIELQWWHFVIPILILVLIMVLSISTVLWKAARNNPVAALKYE